eukprot:jgi/Mesvir1/29575/Mv21386-RA.1
MTTPTDRAMAVSLRTYHRPLDDGTLESWDDVVNRVIATQEWLWVRAKDGKALDADEKRELDDLRVHIANRKIAPAGRTLWLGGTELSRRRESCMFNCSFTEVETVYDIVDVLWLLCRDAGESIAAARAIAFHDHAEEEEPRQYGDFVHVHGVLSSSAPAPHRHPAS